MHTPKWQYYHECSFLADSFTPRQTENNLETDTFQELEFEQPPAIPAPRKRKLPGQSIPQTVAMSPIERVIPLMETAVGRMKPTGNKNTQSHATRHHQNQV